MIISCPNCASRFLVEPDQMGANKRKVKCSKCKHIWVARNLDIEPSNDKELIKKSQAIAAGLNLPTVIPVTISKRLYIIPSILVFLILSSLWALYPDLTSRLGICGPMCEGQNMKIENISYVYDKDSAKLLLEYQIVNYGPKASRAPEVEIELIDKRNEKLNTLIANPNKNGKVILEPGKSISGKLEFSNLSPDAHYVQLYLGNELKFFFR